MCSRSTLGPLKKDVTGWSPWKSESEISMQEIQYYEYFEINNYVKGGKDTGLGRERTEL